MKKESFGLWIGFFILFGGYFALQSYYAQKEQPPLQAAVVPHMMPLAQTKPSPQIKQIGVTEQKFFQTQNKTLMLQWSSLGGCLTQNTLIGQKQSSHDLSPVSVLDNDRLCQAFGFRANGEDLRLQPADITINAQGGIDIVQRTPSLEIKRSIQFTEDGYNGSFLLQVTNLTDHPITASVDVEVGSTSDRKSRSGFWSTLLSSVPFAFHGVSLLLPDDTEMRELTPFVEAPTHDVLVRQTAIEPLWVSSDSLYWLSAMIPKYQRHPVDFELIRTGYNLRKNAQSEIDQTIYEAWLKHPVQLASGQALLFPYEIYFGPKSETLLKPFENVNLWEAIDYGFFKIIAKPMYHVLEFIHHLVNNWGLAIILLTIFINILFLPLQMKAFTSAQKLQVIQPKMKELQQKYKDDKVTLQKETMALMSASGANPLGGCLPLLPQIPVFFALDSALRHTFDLRQSPFFFWIQDLSVHDPYFVLPILMSIVMIGYQKMIPMPSIDPMQAKMMKLLPIIFSIFMVFYPSGLALYVITNTLISMLRQFVFMKKYKVGT